MPLPKVREFLESAQYLPASLRFHYEGAKLNEMLSGETHAFCWIAAQKQAPAPLSFQEFYGHIWADDGLTLAAYHGLSPEAQAEALGFFTFQVHELTHHFDFLITPFGVNFHSKLFREYRAFEKFAPLLLREGAVPPGRLVDYDPFATGVPHSAEFLAAWDKLRSIIQTLEALGDGGMPPNSKHVVAGWQNNVQPLPLLNYSLDPVTVRSFLFTFSHPDEAGWYLRPVTILETRALIHALLWIMKLFGEDERARAPLVLYLATFYARDSIPLDYRLLLDLLASRWGVDFHAFVAAAPVANAKQILMTANIACWYALQAPPPMPEGTVNHSNPIMRLVHALQFLEEVLLRGASFACGTDALAAMDQTQDAPDLELYPITTILAYCAGFAGHLRQLNRQEDRDPVFRKHFERVLGAQQRLLTHRIAKGYISYAGLPEDGHPVWGLRSEQEIEDLAPDAYVPDERVMEWFDARYDLLYHSMQPEEVRQALIKFFA